MKGWLLSFIIIVGCQNRSQPKQIGRQNTINNHVKATLVINNDFFLHSMWRIVRSINNLRSQHLSRCHDLMHSSASNENWIELNVCWLKWKFFLKKNNDVYLDSQPLAVPCRVVLCHRCCRTWNVEFRMPLHRYAALFHQRNNNSQHCNDEEDEEKGK